MGKIAITHLVTYRTLVALHVVRARALDGERYKLRRQVDRPVRQGPSRRRPRPPYSKAIKAWPCRGPNEPTKGVAKQLAPFPNRESLRTELIDSIGIESQ